MGLVSEIYKMGYVYEPKDIHKKGNIKYIRDDYEIYVTVDLKQKIGVGWASVQVDRKWKTFKVNLVLRSFMTYKNNTDFKVVTENVVEGGSSNNAYYDETTDDKLGGRKEILGAA